MYFIFVPYFMYHIHVECCIKVSYFCILAFVLYFTYICWKRKSLFNVLWFQKAKNICLVFHHGIFFIIYMGLRHFCLHAGTRDSWILRHSLWSINQASTRPAVGARCYQLICTIVGLAEEPPFDKHDTCLCSSASNDLPFVPIQFWLVSFCFK